MANLQLAVKGEYFDAMIRGEKTEEYRLCNDYWNKRIMFREYDRLIITKGYPKRDDSSRRIDAPYEGYEIKAITHPHFGPEPVKVFAIKVNINCQINNGRLAHERRNRTTRHHQGHCNSEAWRYDGNSPANDMDKNTKGNNWYRDALHCCTGVIHDKKGRQQRPARIQV